MKKLHIHKKVKVIFSGECFIAVIKYCNIKENNTAWNKKINLKIETL